MITNRREATAAVPDLESCSSRRRPGENAASIRDDAVSQGESNRREFLAGLRRNFRRVTARENVESTRL
jgi:hypothetical protein